MVGWVAIILVFGPSGPSIMEAPLPAEPLFETRQACVNYIAGLRQQLASIPNVRFMRGECKEERDE